MPLTNPFNVPVIFAKIIAYLIENKKQIPSLSFRVGDQEEFLRLIKVIDTGKLSKLSIEEFSVENLAFVIIYLLTEFPESLLTFNGYNQIVEGFLFFYF